MVLGRNFWIILVVLIVGIGGLVFFTNKKDESSGGNGAKIEKPLEVQADDHVRGKEDAKVTLIEYGDFECPGCGALEPILQQLEADYKDDLKIVFRHFPLVNIHANAMAAHRAAQAAANQGKFWEMHDLLYARQAEWRGPNTTQSSAITIFEGYAEELRLNVDQYKTDVASSGVFDYIDRHMKSGASLDLTGTPSLILQGEKIETPTSYEAFSTLIKEALDKANKDSAATPAEEKKDEAADTSDKKEETTPAESETQQ